MNEAEWSEVKVFLPTIEILAMREIFGCGI